MSIALFEHGTWVVGLVEIDPAASDQPQRLAWIDLPDRFRTALKCYRAGPGVRLETLL